MNTSVESQKDSSIVDNLLAMAIVDNLVRKFSIAGRYDEQSRNSRKILYVLLFILTVFIITVSLCVIGILWVQSKKYNAELEKQRELTDKLRSMAIDDDKAPIFEMSNY